MAISLAKIEQQAHQLSDSERAQLAESLLESLNPAVSEVEAAWMVEVEARVAAFDAGKMEAIPAEQVFAEARNLSN